MLFPLPGVVHDGVEPVCDGEDGTVFKLGADGGLDQVVRLHVYSSRGLIQDQDLGLAEESASQADQLPLAQTEPNRNRKYKDTEGKFLLFPCRIRGGTTATRSNGQQKCTLKGGSHQNDKPC